MKKVNLTMVMLPAIIVVVLVSCASSDSGVVSNNVSGKYIVSPIGTLNNDNNITFTGKEWRFEGKTSRFTLERGNITGTFEMVNSNEINLYIYSGSVLWGTCVINGPDTIRLRAISNRDDFVNGEYLSENLYTARMQERQQAELAAQEAEQQVEAARVETERQAEAARQADLIRTTPNSSDDFRVMQNTQGGITITGYTGTSPVVIIPDTISGIRVTAIGNEAFQRRQIQRVVIPNTVTGIYYQAFKDNPLTEVVITIPADVSSENAALRWLPEGFRNFYISQNKRAGTYIKEGQIWRRE